MIFINAPYAALSISTSSIVSAPGAREIARRPVAARSVPDSLVYHGGRYCHKRNALLALGGQPRGASPEVLPLASTYLGILLLSCVFGLSVFISNGIHRSKGDTLTAMWIAILTNLINIVASIMLAFGIGTVKLGFYGVAWGTVIARTAGTLMSVGLLFSPKASDCILVTF